MTRRFEAFAAGLPPWGAPAGLLCVALLWRLALVQVYCGWEEGDFGYLAMTRGMWLTRFRALEVDETPLYFVLTGLLYGVLGPARVATLAVSALSGSVAAVLGLLLARRHFGEGTAWAVGLALAFQPEMALFGATAMREPLYVALVLGSLVLLGQGRAAGAGGLLGASVLVRFDTLAANFPALALHALRGRDRGRSALRLLGVALGITAAWSLYCQAVHGDYRFWAGAIGKNLASSEGQDLGQAGERLGLSVRVVGALLVRTLPSHVGWPLVAGAVWHGILCASGRLRRPEPTLALLALGNLLVWLGLGAISRYEPGHNLYWKWMVLLAALVCVGGARGLQLMARDLGRRRPWLGSGLLWLCAGWTALSFVSQTTFQVERSRRILKPFVDLADHVERDLGRDAHLLIDYIPLMWMERDNVDRPITLWEGVDSPPGDGPAFGAFLRERRIRYVLWLSEPWTGAPRKAPFLAPGRAVDLGPVRAVPERRDDAAGFIWYRIDPRLDPPPPPPGSQPPGPPPGPGLPAPRDARTPGVLPGPGPGSGG